MAYKFQLGSAILSGTMKVEETLNAASGFELAGTALTATAAELNVLDGLAQGSILLGDGDGAAAITDIKTSGQILVGNGTTAVSVAVSGDATLAANGALTIANNAVETAMIADEQVTLAKLAHAGANTVLVRDAGNTGDPSFKAIGDTQLLIGNGSGFTAAALSGDVTMANNGAVTIANDAVQAAMLNDDVISGQTELAQGSLAAADEILLSDGGVIKRFGVDSLAKDSGALTTEAAIVVADDYILFLDGGATGETKKEQFSDVVDAIAGSGLTATNGVLSTDGAAVQLLSDQDMNLSGGVNVYNGAAPAASRAYTLPSGSNLSNGDVIRVKAGDLATNSVSASIQCQGTDKIEGTLTQIDLESPGAAVTIIYAGSGGFVVF
jgi:hypothetical protein